jgi:two-component system sensor histidine kinase/response regulator
LKILIADDQPTNLKLLRAQLEAEGHQVIVALNGVEALAALEGEKVDAIISDILMPQMDGYRFCYEVRKNPRLQAIPFIFYTATYTSPSDEKLCFELGGDKYLRKPAMVEEILATLREATNGTGRRLPLSVAAHSDLDVMKFYSEQLVSKLEEKNIELQQALKNLQGAHREILELNRNLELRVGERTGELKLLNEELEAFSYSISHDLRAPLRAMGGYANILGKKFGDQMPPEAHLPLQRIRESATQMGQLIDGLLAFAGLGRRSLKKNTVDPTAIVGAVVEQLRSEITGRRVEIEIAELPACQGDSMLLKQVFTNLLSNAFKYSRGRDPAIIKVGWRREKEENVYFVQDNGAGFDMEYSGKLFGVFQRLHSAEEFDGTGVGLAIVHRIISRHGGRIWAEAKVGHGATFYFTLSNPLCLSNQ